MIKTKKKIIMGLLIVLILLLTMSTSQAAGTFTQLNASITSNTNGTLDLTDDYNNTDSINITIDQDIIINGHGHIIDLNANEHIIISSGRTVTLNNITLTNGRSSSNGGAIYNNGGNLTINNSTLNQNTANDDGGAIYNNGGNLNINNSTLNHNNATAYGGAIYNWYGNLTINNSTLKHNTNLAGAIYNWHGTLIINNSTLNQNNAEYGGAIYNWYGNLTINNSTLNHNTANEYGGAILNDYGTLTINNSTLNQNNAENGGAIYNDYGGNIIINNSTLNHNTASSGGAIYNVDGSVVADGNYWGNKNPTDLVSGFVVVDYYRFSLGEDTSVLIGKNITLTSLLRLNTTEATSWSGPTIDTQDITFTSTPNTATLSKSADSVTFSASDVGNYIVRCTVEGVGYDTTVAVIANSSLTITTLNLTTITGILTDTTNNKPINNGDLTISIDNGAPNHVITDENGVYSYDHGLVLMVLMYSL